LKALVAGIALMFSTPAFTAEPAYLLLQLTRHATANDAVVIELRISSSTQQMDEAACLQRRQGFIAAADSAELRHQRALLTMCVSETLPLGDAIVALFAGYQTLPEAK